MSQPSGTLLAWAVSATANIFCWLADGEDPDAWPVYVWYDSQWTWWTHDGGMVEVLTGLLTGSFDIPPPGSSFFESLERPPRFLHWREAARLHAAGADPWA